MQKLKGTSRLLVATGFAVALSGCLPNPPGASNPYDGLTAGGRTPQSVSTGFPLAARGRSVGVVATAGTEKALAYLEDAVNKQRTSPLLNSHYRPGNEAFKKPSYLFDTAMSLLRQKFGRVVQINDLSQARGLDYVALLDLQAVLPTPMNHTFAYDLSMEFLTAGQQRIGTVRGADSQPMTTDCYGWGDAVIDCGVNKNVLAVRTAADNFRADFLGKIR